ncbi:efflux RND transporter periplasmic adaptor subunit [Persicimonas caeni]|uniref:Efflux RND transporter periplasmic adaptor subunit n=1 Tax=Persicimonas caeni TaxID=2292766 RepID=A0A4Y6PQV6_PERCE|nr:efflux RND transporter periplasmic adaptor subunit [Persicimonas caeni]QDG50712.1 efflux RND transporter periplasmic adaptor subunit [Persicimonas caeni]QED31933.1 efflux RND transporter periplasmic adaptor subunit [Persicimonas caeni]
MKTTLKTYVVLAVCAGGLALAGCSTEQEKVDLPSEQATANDEAAAQEADEAEQAEQAERADEAEEADESNKADEGASEASPTTNEAPGAGRRLSGSFEPQRTSSVAASVGGIIREVYVEEGDVVDKGDRILNIDAKDYQLRVDQARAAVKAAQAQVDTLQTEYERLEKLLAKEAVAPAEADQLSGNLAAARAQLEQAKVGLRMAQKARADSVVRAPYAGVVTAVNVAEGSFAAPGPSPLIQLEEVQNLYLRVSVPEEYAKQVDEGDKLSVQVPALDRQMTLTVDRINPSVAKSSRAFDVLAEVDNPDLAIRSGMFAEITLAEDAAGGGPTAEGGEQ